jgi:hypothetical protein
MFAIEADTKLGPNCISEAFKQVGLISSAKYGIALPMFGTLALFCDEVQEPRFAHWQIARVNRGMPEREFWYVVHMLTFNRNNTALCTDRRGRNQSLRVDIPVDEAMRKYKNGMHEIVNLCISFERSIGVVRYEPV